MLNLICQGEEFEEVNHLAGVETWHASGRREGEKEAKQQRGDKNLQGHYL